MRLQLLGVVASTGVLVACAPPPRALDLVFIDGRAVAPAGDTLLAFTQADVGGILVWDRRTERLDTLAAGLLQSPQQIQYQDGYWYVSDVRAGHPFVVELTAGGEPVQSLNLTDITNTPHQFAVLPDGGIVLEGRADQLVTVTDSASPPSTFAITEHAERTGLLIAAHGGVLHVVPGTFVTLYNANGHIRWRLPWPWNQAAFVADLAVDDHGRIHVLAGQEGRRGFVVFTLSPINGEVVRWSEPGPYATFVVDRMGAITPDSAAKWLR